VLITTHPPDATITIDGVKRGTAPFKTLLLGGEHRLELKLDGYTKLSTTMHVEPPKPLDLKFELQRFGSVEVKCIAAEGDMTGVHLELDGTRIDAAKHVFEGVPTGEHKATCYLPGGHSVTEPVSSTPGKQAGVAIDLTDPKKMSLYSGWSLLGYCNDDDVSQTWGFGPLYGCNSGDSYGLLTMPFLYGGSAQDAHGVQIGTGIAIMGGAHGLTIAPIPVVHRNASGLQLGLMHYVGKDADVGQIAPLFNYVGNDLAGAQISLLNIAVRDASGPQLGVLAAYGGHDVVGTQVGLIAFAGNDAGALQIGPIFTYAGGDADVFQLGAVNIVGESMDGVQLGAALAYAREDAVGFQTGAVTVQRTHP